MPYKAKARRFRKSRRSYAKKSSSWGRWFQKGVSPKEAIDYAVGGVKYLTGLVNAEMYKLDSTGGFSITDSGAQIQPLCAVAQGDGDGQRTGNSIFVRSFYAKNYVTWNPAGNPVQSVMIALVQDTQQIGDTSPAFTDVFSTATVGSHLNATTVGRFKILYRQVCHLDVNKPRVNVNIRKVMRHHVRFNGSATTDVQKGGLYLMWVSDQATANYPTTTYNHRLSYHDN